MLASNGDCLYATAIARQIKADFPGCHLTWAIGSLSASVLANNSDVDEVWELPQNSWADMENDWNLFEIDARRLADAGQFDYVFLTQISPARFANYDGTVRPSIFRNYGRSVTVPVDVTINLTEQERYEVDNWFKANPASDASQVVLFECSSKSGQSFMTKEMALQIAHRITEARSKTVVIISTHEKLAIEHPRIVSGDALSIRQITRLTDYVDLFVGCGAGLTVAATAGVAKPSLPNIQILSRSTSVYASFRHDFAYFGKPTANFLELTTEDPGHLSKVALVALTDSFATAKAEFDDPVPITFEWYLRIISTNLVERGRYLDAVHSLLVTMARYGQHPDLVQFARYYVLPFTGADLRHALPHRRNEIERLRAIVSNAKTEAACAIPAGGSE
jgi:ADP-heptose:LPS heptosyltransferase